MYGLCGKCASVAVCNSSWTQAHVRALWGGDPRVVFPPCDVDALLAAPAARRASDAVRPCPSGSSGRRRTTRCQPRAWAAMKKRVVAEGEGTEATKAKRFLERRLEAFREKEENATRRRRRRPRGTRFVTRRRRVSRRRGRGATRVSARARRGAARRGFRGVPRGRPVRHAPRASRRRDRGSAHHGRRALRHLRRGVHGRRRGARGARERGPGDGHRRAGVQNRGRLDGRRRRLRRRSSSASTEAEYARACSARCAWTRRRATRRARARARARGALRRKTLRRRAVPPSPAFFRKWTRDKRRKDLRDVVAQERIVRTPEPAEGKGQGKCVRGEESQRSQSRLGARDRVAAESEAPRGDGRRQIAAQAETAVVRSPHSLCALPIRPSFR